MDWRNTLRVLAVPVTVAILLSCLSFATDPMPDIDNPSGNPKYAPSITIPAKGNTFAGVEVYVNVNKNGLIYGEANVAPGKQSLDWNKDFMPPSGGWPTGDDWKCQVWDAAKHGTDDPATETETFRVSTM